jgi:hypothetical protein
MAIDSYTSYRRLAQSTPAKALRYRKSIKADLARDDIAAGERIRLNDALRGIADGLHASDTCERCGRHLEADDSKARGLGSHCARIAS